MNRNDLRQPPPGGFKDISPISEESELEKVIADVNTLINAFNFLAKSFSFEKNFNGFIAKAVIPATSELKIQHFLGVTPKYRLILRQEGNGVITDIPSGWNDKIITLYNNGAVEVTDTILIAREENGIFNIQSS